MASLGSQGASSQLGEVAFQHMLRFSVRMRFRRKSSWRRTMIPCEQQSVVLLRL